MIAEDGSVNQDFFKPKKVGAPVWFLSVSYTLHLNADANT